MKIRWSVPFVQYATPRPESRAVPRLRIGFVQFPDPFFGARGGVGRDDPARRAGREEDVPFTISGVSVLVLRLRVEVVRLPRQARPIGDIGRRDRLSGEYRVLARSR